MDLDISVLLKYLFLLVNLSVLVWWSNHSISAYSDMPTASTLSLKYGEDGHKLVKFPLISICYYKRPIQVIEDNKYWKNKKFCKKPEIPFFLSYLEGCLESGNNTNSLEELIKSITYKAQWAKKEIAI